MIKNRTTARAVNLRHRVPSINVKPGDYPRFTVRMSGDSGMSE